MKKIILILVLFVFVGCKSVKQNSNEVVITSKNEVFTNDYTIVISKIISDSRCPEGTNCIWAGELVIEFSVVQNKQIKETKIITFSPDQKEENLVWFQKYVPNQKLQKIDITTFKTDTPKVLKDYKVTLVVE